MRDFGDAKTSARTVRRTRGEGTKGHCQPKPRTHCPGIRCSRLEYARGRYLARDTRLPARPPSPETAPAQLFRAQIDANRALGYASKRKHEFITLEHLLGPDG